MLDNKIILVTDPLLARPCSNWKLELFTTLINIKRL